MKSSLQRACRSVELTGELPLFALAGPGDAYVCCLESLGPATRLSRYSLLGLEPFLVFQARGAECFAGPPGALERLPGDPFAGLAGLLERYRAPAPPTAPDLPFLGGAMGYLGYELLHQLEQVPRSGGSEPEVPDACVLFFDAVVGLDRLTGRRYLVANGFAPDLREAERRAEARLAEVLGRLERAAGRRVPEAGPGRPSGEPLRSEAELVRLGIRPELGREAYLRAVHRIQEHLRAGDVYQACLTYRLETGFEGSGLALYRALREVNPAPFAAWLRLPGVEVISSSPERFLRLERSGWAESRPIKGTRPRGRSAEEDLRLREALATCEKDLAENVMIVDLARNDLGRVCELGSVHVPELRVIEAHPFTFQMVSTIRGRLRPELGPIELVRAAFPGGSMTGAPKVEAMKILSGLEPSPRGIYAGSLGYFDFDGSFDLNIVIRTFVKQGSRLRFHVGGAIVADSVPEEEYQETLDKARGLVAALQLARAGAPT